MTVLLVDSMIYLIFYVSIFYDLIFKQLTKQF